VGCAGGVPGVDSNVGSRGYARVAAGCVDYDRRSVTETVGGADEALREAGLADARISNHDHIDVDQVVEEGLLGARGQITMRRMSGGGIHDAVSYQCRRCCSSG